MKKLTGLFAAMVISVGFSTIADDANLLAAKDLKDWKGAKIIDDGNAIEATNSTFVYSKIIPINPESAYVLTGMFKSGNDQKNLVYFGMQFFDAKKTFINPTSITPVNKSETELVADCKKGAKVITLKDVSKTMLDVAKSNRLCLGFESDKGLPNNKLSTKVIKLEKKDSDWEGTLEKPLPFDAAKGTKVQGHYICGHYMYAVTANKNFADWTKLSGIIKPEVKSGSPGGAIWPGTKFGRVIVLANWGQKKGEVLQMKDIRLTAKTK